MESKKLNPIKQILIILGSWFTKGLTPYVFLIVYLAIASVLVYFNRRSVPVFLLFISSLGMIYYLPVKNWYKLVLGLIVILIVIPIIGARNIFYLDIIFQICVFSALALGLNILTGFTGLLNFGYVAFYAVGAYMWGFFGGQQMFLLHAIPGSAAATTVFFLPANSFYLFLFIGLGVAGVIGVLLGLPVLRVRGDYLTVVTLGFGEVIRMLANNLDKPLNLTNGPQGISPIQRPILPEPLLNFLRMIMDPVVGHKVTLDEFYNLFFYILALLIVFVIILVTIRMDDSKFGRAWVAIREDELAAAAMGIPLVLTKLLAFAFAASFAGIMGVMFSASRMFVSPELFTFMQSISVLVMVILGGLGSIPGVILGATVVVLINLQLLTGLSLYLGQLRQSDAVIPVINFAWKNLSSQLDPAKYQRLVFGIILVVMMIYRPNGLIAAKRRRRELVYTDGAIDDGKMKLEEAENGAA
jgi:branched-chain amino acid transport system permease protein